MSTPDSDYLAHVEGKPVYKGDTLYTLRPNMNSPFLVNGIELFAGEVYFTAFGSNCLIAKPALCSWNPQPHDIEEL